MLKSLSPKTQNWLAGLIFAGIVVAGAGLALNDFFRRQADTVTATQYANTQTAHSPTAQAAAAASATALAEWPVVLQDNFAEAAYAWTTGDLNEGRVTGQQTIEKGLYRWRLHTTQGAFVTSWVTPTMSTADFYVEVEAGLVSAETKASYGLLFSGTPVDYYYFSIDQAAQTYTLARFNGDAWERPLVAAHSNDIYYNLSPGYGGNRLGVRVRAGQVELYINDQLVQVVAEKIAQPLGTVGLAVSLARSNSDYGFAFDNFVWRAPAVLETPSAP